MPKVSVIIPTFNSAQYLPEALKSVLTQTYNDLEIIVIDDGSTDNTSEVVAALNSSKIKYIYQPNSGGPSSPRNRGIRESTGQYVSLFDADDIMLSDKIGRAVHFLDSEPNLGLVFTNFVILDKTKGLCKDPFLTGYYKFLNIRKRDIGDSCYVIKSNDAYQTLFYENYVGTSGVIISRCIFENVGVFDENLKNGDDRDMWFRITRDYDIGFIDVVGHYYRVHGTGISLRDSGLAENRIKVIRRQLENHLDRSTRRQAHRLIATNLFGIGYQFQHYANMKEAKKYYFLSLKEYFYWRTVKGIMITLLPPRPFIFLRKLLKWK